jgi:RNA polymerase sigma factor (sigma-70 family)
MGAQPQSPLPAKRLCILERLLFRHEGTLRRAARRNSLSAADAEDALQDACLTFLNHYEGEAAGALPWLLLVLKRRAWDISAKERRRAAGKHLVSGDPRPGSEFEIGAVDQRDGPPRLAERAEAVAHRLALLQRLKPDERTALILIGLGATYREVAALRGWTLTKVKRCAAEGRAALRQFAARGEKPSP